MDEGFDDDDDEAAFADDNDDCADDNADDADDYGVSASFSQLLSKVDWSARTLITFFFF